MSLFGGEASSAIALAEDEARMLGRSIVEPEHLLLATMRHRGRVREMLKDTVSAGGLHAAIVDGGGLGDDLVLGRVPRSRRLDGVLARAMELATQWGMNQTEGVHLLLALAEREEIGALLGQFGVVDVASMVRERFPPRTDRYSKTVAGVQLVSAALGEWRTHPRPLVPAFERFTSDARRAISAAGETAARLEHREVAPFHLLLGCLQVPDSCAARLLHPVWEDGELGPVAEAVELALRLGPAPSHQATGMFSEAARRVVAQDSLKVAYRAGHQQITTGHLLLATLDSQDRTTTEMTRPHTQRLARTLARGLPGHDPGQDEGELAWIQFDLLMRILTLDFRRILPPGWTVIGSARSDIHLQVPDSRSESDFQIRPGWITSEPGTAPERLVRVTHWILERLQAAVIEATGAPWPKGPDGQPSAAYADVIPDQYNPRLRLGYGQPQTPTLKVFQHDQLINMLTAIT